MTHDDLLAIDIGDSIIGLTSHPDDELPIVSTGEPVWRPNGGLIRTLVVGHGRNTLAVTVRAGDHHIRGRRL